MADFLGQLSPRAREMRAPLALGYSLMVIAWTGLSLVTGDDFGATDPVGQLYYSTIARLDPLLVLAASTFVAALIGSGLVRLIDRLMQLLPRRYSRGYSPLDALQLIDLRHHDDGKADGLDRQRRLRTALSFAREVWKSALSRREDEGDRAKEEPDLHMKLTGASTSGFFKGMQKASIGRLPVDDVDLIRDHLRTLPGVPPYDQGRILAEWKIDEDPSAYEADKRLFLRHLRRDGDFAALAAEQLLRAVMIVPLTLGVVLSSIWALATMTPSVFVLLGLLLLADAIAWLDYLRIGSLMYLRWTRLVNEFPHWLDDADEKRRQERIDRKAAAIEAHGSTDTAWPPSRRPKQPAQGQKPQQRTTTQRTTAQPTEKVR